MKIGSFASKGLTLLAVFAGILSFQGVAGSDAGVAAPQDVATAGVDPAQGDAKEDPERELYYYSTKNYCTPFMITLCI